MGFRVRAQGAPGVLGAGLHDGAGRRAHGADVGRLPQLAHQAVQPTLEVRAGQGRVPPGLLHRARTDGDVEHWVEAVETLLHVAVLRRPVVVLQSVLWRDEEKQERTEKEMDRVLIVSGQTERGLWGREKEKKRLELLNIKAENVIYFIII